LDNTKNTYRSDEELYFSWWLNELQHAGIIKEYMYEVSTFTLSETKWYPILRQLKTKTKVDQLSLMDEHKYTPDFLIEWNEEYLNKFWRIINDEECARKCSFFASRGKKNNKPYTFFEVKGSFDRNNMTRLFRITQKWMYDKYDLYVDLVKVPDLFQRTFTPNRFRWTAKTMKPRTLPKGYKLFTLNEYLIKLDI
jgi:hypothetical protein